MELDPDSGRKMICSEEQYNNNTCPSIDDFLKDLIIWNGPI